MPEPFGAKFDRFAQETNGLVAFGLDLPVKVSGVALVTGFIFAEEWLTCFDAVSTPWTACASLPSTSWSDNNPSVTTTWELIG